ncbi:hypothetical protein MB02_04440 [Croceicoccus estronivorus]|uniref:hypothetical protein n=1 Tax=Croceicoccus estronivorus TaxID=1172626 RepID=UPI0008316AF6|nr:hypothetical protein [Croceicoccus estronivorus]OCC24732.1 hypothetical protein MB02_04440 [Croceicoccus estronivorus]
MTDDPQLKDIKQRVEAAETRNSQRLADRAAQAKNRVATFIGEHPVASIASGIAVGTLIGTLIPKRRASVKMGALAALVAEAGAEIAQRSWQSARNTGRAGQKSLEHLGDRVSDSTIGLREEIERFAEEAIENVRSAGKQASQQAKSVTGKIGSHLRH